MSESELHELKQKRGLVKDAVTRFKNYVFGLEINDNNRDVILKALKLRFDKIQNAHEEFSELQTKISLNETDEHAISSEFEHFENAHFSALAQAEQLLKNCATDLSDQNSLDVELEIPSAAKTDTDLPNGETPVSSQKNSDGHKIVKLPTIKLPTSDGNIENWLLFYDMFNSVVHENSFLSDIKKLHYLRSSLKGDAAAVLQSLATSSESYSHAWI